MRLSIIWEQYFWYCSFFIFVVHRVVFSFCCIAILQVYAMYRCHHWDFYVLYNKNLHCILKNALIFFMRSDINFPFFVDFQNFLMILKSMNNEITSDQVMKEVIVSFVNWIPVFLMLSFFFCIYTCFPNIISIVLYTICFTLLLSGISIPFFIVYFLFRVITENPRVN